MHNTGATTLCAILERLGVRVIFGLPGSETVELLEALRRSNIRMVLATDERAATFMANGYFRASGRIAAVMVIGGPGFTHALSGLAEAYEDSVGLVCLVMVSDKHPDRQFRLQAINHRAIAAPIVKSVRKITSAGDLPHEIVQAYTQAMTGEPGPVVVEISSQILAQSCEIPDDFVRGMEPTRPKPSAKQIEEVLTELSRAGRVAIYAGQGAAAAADQVLRLAESLRCPVLTTCSGRGIVPENHPFSFYFDYSLGKGGETINDLLQKSDVIIALGCKFTHNGTGGYRLTLPPEKLIHVDASADVLGANYPARLTVLGDVAEFMSALWENRNRFAARPAGWTSAELGTWRSRLQAEKQHVKPREPIVSDELATTCAAFFSALRAALPDESSIVTDSGWHQTLTRWHFEVRCPRGMIVPADFQSMGFGIPAAIGAKLAVPGRPVVAVVGDGGFAMSGMELGTAVREHIPLTVVVFNDGKLGSIRLMQLEHSGHEHAVALHGQDYALFAESLGASYALWNPAAPDAFAEAVRQTGVTLIEVPLADSPQVRRLRTAGRARAVVRRTFGPRWTARIKKWLGG